MTEEAKEPLPVYTMFDDGTMSRIEEIAKGRKTQVRDPGDKELFDAMEAVLDTKAGVAVFQHIFNIAGHNDLSAKMNKQGDYCPEKTLYNEGRRSLWLDVRSLMTRKGLIAVEFPEPQESK